MKTHLLRLLGVSLDRRSPW